MGDARIEIQSEFPNVAGSSSSSGGEKWNQDVVDRDRIRLMETALSADWQRRRLRKSADCCCIFRIPPSFGEGCYQPSMVSIGPYHHGREELKTMEENKRRSLATLLERTRKKMGLTLEDYFVKVKSVEGEARDCYSEAILLESHEFVEILVVDGCFIVELFRKVAGRIPYEEGDPILSLDWTFRSLMKDLTCLENQIPFVVLQALFDLTQSPDKPGYADRVALSSLALHFFSFEPSIRRPMNIWRGGESVVVGRHLLDFLRLSFVIEMPEPESPPSNPPGTARSDVTRCISNWRNPGCKTTVFVPVSHAIRCISMLRGAGIKVTRREGAQSVLAIRFKGSAIEMPPIRMDDFMAAFLRNCVAFEHCLECQYRSITKYAILLDGLIDTYEDVEVLCDQGILENHLGTKGEVATFVNELVKGVIVDDYILHGYLHKLFGEVNQYYNDSWNVYWAILKNKYFNSPWSIMSFFAAIVLLLLSVAQTLFAFLAYVNPPHG
ncbi:unnamed protein product, partial [Cuscuta europaea]